MLTAAKQRARDRGRERIDRVVDERERALDVLIVSYIGRGQGDVTDAFPDPHRLKRRHAADAVDHMEGLAPNGAPASGDGAANSSGVEELGVGEEDWSGEGHEVGT